MSGARVVIDSSSLPTHTMILSQTSGVDVRLVHLVRDSRGVAYSNTKRVVKTVTNGEPTLLPTHGAFSASARYALYNGLTQSAARKGVDYMLLRYEDLIAEPETNLRAVIRHAGEPPADAALPFLTEQGVLLAENHLVDGNPVRFAKGAVPLRADEEWRTKMRPGPRRAVTALTLPFLASLPLPAALTSEVLAAGRAFTTGQLCERRASSRGPESRSTIRCGLRRKHRCPTRRAHLLDRVQVLQHQRQV